MKKTVFALLMAMVLPFAVQAQEEKTADQYKNEGNAFVKEKNFQAGLEAYEKAIELWSEEDLEPATVYNAGTCAKNIKQWDKAIKYFKQSIALDYKADFSTYYLADAYAKNNEADAQLATLEEGFGKFKEGKAASVIQKNLVKVYRDKAMVFYKEGSKILEECQTAKPEQYAEIQGRAKEQFKQALPLAEKALEVNPNDEQTKKVVESIKEQLK